MFPSSSAWSDPTDERATENEEHLARLGDALSVIDFQHWGLAPASFELLYFILHCLSMWGIERDHIPWLVQTYVDALTSSARVLACTQNDPAGSSKQCCDHHESQVTQCHSFDSSTRGLEHATLGTQPFELPDPHAPWRIHVEIPNLLEYKPECSQNPSQNRSQDECCHRKRDRVHGVT